MTLSKFLVYWSLTFAILFIWAFSIATAMADVKDDLLANIRKRVGRARLRPIDPLAGRSVAETLAPTAMDEKERWVFHLVSAMAIALRLQVGILVLQDSMGHYLVHFTQGKRLVTYRVDKAWVADAMAGKADQRERISAAVEQYLRQEFLGQAIPAKPAPAPAKPAAAGAAAAAPKPTGAAAPAASVGSAQGGQAEMSREERIAAAKAKADAIRAQRAAGGQPPEPPQGPTQQ
jgi:putative hemolysin